MREEHRYAFIDCTSIFLCVEQHVSSIFLPERLPWQESMTKTSGNMYRELLSHLFARRSAIHQSGPRFHSYYVIYAPHQKVQERTSMSIKGRVWDWGWEKGTKEG